MPSSAPPASGQEVAVVRPIECSIHRCRFVDFQPSKITALAFSHPSNLDEPTPESLLLAVGRSNGDIQLWSPINEWVHKITLKGGKGRSIEGIVWVPAPSFQRNAPPRLFSIGSSTYLTEWDITTGLPKQHLASNAGAIWSVDASPDGKTLALGCEDGTVMLVDVADGSFAFSRFLERQRSRILSLSWHPNGEFLVGGCADSTIRAWEVSHPHGRIVAQMKVDYSYMRGKISKRRRKVDTLVWVVKVASDGTVVSGDSTGSLKIWESQFWSLTHSFQVHKSDILCLAFDSNENMIFSSGVDRKAMRYQRHSNGKWAHIDGRTYHKHDVRAMASFESAQVRMILSGGVDGSLSCLSFVDSQEYLWVMAPTPQQSVVKLAAAARLLLSWTDNQVKIWRVEEIGEAEFEGEDHIEKRYLLEMEFNDEENISTAAISPNGEYLLIATLSHSKLFALTPDDATSKLTVETLGVFPHGARLATFNPNGDTIVLVTPDSEVQIHPFLDEDAPTTRFPYNDNHSYINKIAISPDGKIFATSSSTSLVVIQSFNPDIPPFTLPQPSTAITSLDFLTTELISVTLADGNRLLLFERSEGEWFLQSVCQNSENMPKQIVRTKDKCLGTFIMNNDTSRIWLWGANWLAWINPYELKPSIENASPKVNGETDVVHNEYMYWVTYRYREVLLVNCLSSSQDKAELVAVERPRHEILEDITEPRFYHHEYGT